MLNQKHTYNYRLAAKFLYEMLHIQKLNYVANFINLQLVKMLSIIIRQQRIPKLITVQLIIGSNRQLKFKLDVKPYQKMFKINSGFQLENQIVNMKSSSLFTCAHLVNNNIGVYPCSNNKKEVFEIQQKVGARALECNDQEIYSGSLNCFVYIWDMQKTCIKNSFQTKKNNPVNGILLNPKKQNQFYTRFSNQLLLQLFLISWDKRAFQPVLEVKNFFKKGLISTFDTNPFCLHYVLVGSNSGQIKLIDTRAMPSINVVKQLKYQNGSEINQIKFSSVKNTQFYTAEQNGKVNVWDLVGWSDSKQTDNKDNVVFMHGMNEEPALGVMQQKGIIISHSLKQINFWKPFH